MTNDDDRRRLLLWISACSFFVVFIISIWYWFYLHYYQKESSSSLLPRATEHHDQQTRYGEAQQRGYQGPQTQGGHEIHELETVHENTRWKAGGEMGATAPVAVPPRSAARNDWGGSQCGRFHMNIISPVSKEGVAQSRSQAGDQRAIELTTDGRRHYSVACSDSNGAPQMTPETGPSAAKTPEGQRTPLPRYTLEPRGTDPPIYAETEPSSHAARGPPRRPTS